MLAQGPVGYARLAKAISEAQLAGEKGAPRTSLAHLADAARAPVHLDGQRRAARATTTGSCSPVAARGPCPPRCNATVRPPRERALAELVDAFGRDRVLVELWDHGDPLDRHRNDALVQIALQAGVEVVATNNVHYATPARRPLATALAAVRSRRSLDEVDGWLPAGSFAHLRSAREQQRRFARWPGAVERTVEIAQRVRVRPEARGAAPARLSGARRSRRDVVAARARAARRGDRLSASRIRSTTQAMHQIEYELSVIEQLGFPGYFLLLHDIVEFCRRSDIYCQGRGSAANSAVCYALGVTKADAVDLGLLFERFLSPERDGPPDIDLDIEHQRREEVIQYVYERYGRDRAAQVANVITYRPRSALREMAKAAGVAPGQADALGKWVDRWAAGPEAFGELVDQPRTGVAISGSRHASPRRKRERYQRRFERTRAGPDARRRAARRPARLPRARRRSRRSRSQLAAEVIDFPRHLGIHSGGMVMADRPLLEFCPIEWARMEGRSVLQWDKDDCAAAGPREVRPARPRHAHDAAPRGRPRARVRRRRHRSRDDPAGERGLRPVVRGRHRRRVPGREPRADGDAAAPAAAQLLRPRGGSRVDPARPDPGRLGAPVPPAPQRRGGGHLHPSAHRSRAWRRRSACRCSRSSSCSSRSTARGSARPRPTSCARRWDRSARRRAWRACANG